VTRRPLGAYTKNDLDAVRRHTLVASECELKLPAGVSLRQAIAFEISDINAVPRDYLEIDTRKIREQLRIEREEMQIPGIRVTHKFTIAAGA